MNSINSIFQSLGDYALFRSMVNYVDSRIAYFTESTLAGVLTLVGFFALVLLTLWIMWYGYQLVMGNSQASAKDFVYKAVRAWIIIAFATGLAASMGFSIRTVTTDLSNLVSEAMTGSDSGSACVTNTGNNNFTGCKIDKNLVRMQAAMAFVNQLDTGADPVLEDKKARASLMTAAGIGGPAIVAGGLLLTLKVAMALFIALGPIFIMCLLFKVTTPLFQKWLYYGLSTMFATAMFAVVSDIAMDLVENTTAALFVSDLFTTTLDPTGASNAAAAGIMNASVQQLGLGLMLSTLLITTPAMAANFFNGVMGSYAAQNHLTTFGAGQTSAAYGGAGGYGATGAAGAKGANGTPAPSNTGGGYQDRPNTTPQVSPANTYIPQTNASVNQDAVKTSSAVGNARSSQEFATHEVAQSDKSVKDQAVKLSLMLVSGALVWTSGGVQEAKAQACAPGGYVLHLDGYSVCNYIGGNCIQHPPGLIPQACLPQPDNTAPPPVIQKPSSYGAVAENKRTGLIGTSSNQSTKRASTDLALQRCGNDCEITMTYSNQCMAYAYGTTKKGTGVSLWNGLTQSKAERKALLECSKRAKNCKILLSECSLP